MLNLKENDRINDNSLCSNCLYGSDCVFRKATTTPIIFCEEYGGFDLIQTPLKKSAVVSYEAVTEEINGICSNCDHRAHCCLRSKNSMILSCELYQ